MRGKDSIILGMSMGHGDSSAALVVGDRLVAAVEEERFVRIKHYSLYPKHAIHYCLSHAGIAPGLVDTIAIARQPWNALAPKLWCLIQHPRLLKSRTQNHNQEYLRTPLPVFLESEGLSHARQVRVEHHLAHMASSRFLCPDERVALLSIDALGDFVSAAMGFAEKDTIRIVDRTYFPHSLGFFYTALTQYLGFPYFGDEFKVMGLSSYGKPEFLPQLRTLIQPVSPFGFRLNLDAFPILRKPMQYSISPEGQPEVPPFYDEKYLEELLGFPPREYRGPLDEKHMNLAKSVQACFEEVASALLHQLYKRVPTDSVALSGGCAHNSVWVGKIPCLTPFKNVFVAPASHDAGICVGAAIHAAGHAVSPEGGHWALLGPSFSLDTPPALSAERPEVSEQSFSQDEMLIEWMVAELAQGHIIGLFTDRLEFGPRALGSRSIIADPRPADIRDRLNERVKHRESFRPFAASVLWEEQADWFQNSFYCPSMEAVFPVRAEMKEKIRGVVHVDDTCRIQSVTRETQPFYYQLIESFRKKTGVPMIINTSFNDSEPIVCTEHDAVNCFLNSDLDHLVIGRKAYSKETGVRS